MLRAKKKITPIDDITFFGSNGRVNIYGLEDENICIDFDGAEQVKFTKDKFVSMINVLAFLVGPDGSTITLTK